MRKIILNIGIALMLGIILVVFTGCGEEEEVKVNNTVSNVNNKRENTNKIQNKVKNETNTSNNNVKNSNSKNEANTSKNENKQTNQVKETNLSNNENQSVSQNETAQKKTFNIGNNVFHYGNYKGSGNKFIDGSVVSATVTINLKEDGTYTYNSTNQKVSKNRSGTYEIKNNRIVLNGNEPLEYSILGNDSFIENQGTGFTFLYQEK